MKERLQTTLSPDVSLLMEAAVTFAGFAASFAILIAVVGVSLQTVPIFWSIFRDSPTNLKSLNHAVAENKARLKDIQMTPTNLVGIPESR